MVKNYAMLIGIRSIVAAFFVGLGIYEYRELAAWELTGGSHRMGSISHMLYDLGGKNLVAGADILVAIGVIVYAIFEVRKLAADRRAASA